VGKGKKGEHANSAAGSEQGSVREVDSQVRKFSGHNIEMGHGRRYLKRAPSSGIRCVSWTMQRGRGPTRLED